MPEMDEERRFSSFKNKIDQHDKEYPMRSFHTKDIPETNITQGNHRKRLDRDVDDRGAGGGATGVGATDCTELGAHGYEVEPRDVVDESRFVMESLSNVRQPFL